MHRFLFIRVFLALAVGAASPAGWQRGASLVPSVSSSTPSGYLLVVTDSASVQLLDPMTGRVVWRLDTGDALTAVVEGTGGVLYLSASASDASGTDVFAWRRLENSPVFLAHVPEQAAVQAIAESGDSLTLVELPESLRTRPDPIRVFTIPLPTDWQGGGMVAEPLRELGAGIFYPDRSRWFRAAGNTVRVADLTGEDDSKWSVILLPTRGSYASMLYAPVQDSLFFVDYYAQVIHVIDPNRLRVTQSTAIDRRLTKQPLCAAALAPLGDRLYVIEHDGNTADGIHVFDTSSVTRVAHFLPDRDFYCLAVSSDGDRLFATTSQSIVSVDAADGTLLNEIPFQASGQAPLHTIVAISGVAQ